MARRPVGRGTVSHGAIHFELTTDLRSVCRSQTENEKGPPLKGWPFQLQPSSSITICSSVPHSMSLHCGRHQRPILPALFLHSACIAYRFGCNVSHRIRLLREERLRSIPFACCMISPLRLSCDYYVSNEIKYVRCSVLHLPSGVLVNSSTIPNSASAVSSSSQPSA